MSLPWEPLPCDSGYFLMVDVSKCRDLIPKMYFEDHDYDKYDSPKPKDKDLIQKNYLYMPTTGANKKKVIPLDLAFARWMSREKGVTMMPNSFFYDPEAP